MGFTRHFVSLSPDGAATGAIDVILGDESGIIRHVTVQMPAEYRALRDSLDSLGPRPLGERRQKGREARAGLEARVFAAAERQLHAPTPITLAASMITSPAASPTQKPGVRRAPVARPTRPKTTKRVKTKARTSGKTRR